MVPSVAEEVVEALTGAVDRLQSLDLDALTAREAMALTGAVEVVRRRLDASTDRLAGHLEDTGKFGVDGHRNAKDALTHLGRLPSSESHGRLQTARQLKALPAVAAAYARGEIPTEAARAVARLASNPRVAPLLDDVIDKIIAEQGSTDTHRSFLGWLKDLERAADPDGAGADAELTHDRRTTQLSHNAVDGSSEMRVRCGTLHGAILAEVLSVFEAAEWEADRQEAIRRHGSGATPDQFPRTPAQRRTDAVVAIFRAAGTAPADGRAPEPLVNVVVSAEALEDELARIASGAARPSACAPPDRRIDETAESHICQTMSGRRLDPSDVIACLLVGWVRRVVVDSASNVIDLGRRRRLFTGSAREAVEVQAAVRRRGDTPCFWASCSSPPHRQQCDHSEPWRSVGRSDVDNGDLACGVHNRLKESGFRPVRRADGGYDLLRPDGTRITPSA